MHKWIMHVLEKKNALLSFGVYLVVFLSCVYPASDRDWGWHYKYGEYFFSHHTLLLKDIFSSTLPGYYWVNHSWLYDLLLYKVSNWWGFTGLAFLGALFSTLTFWLVARNFKLSYWKLAFMAIFFILISEIGIASGLRSQVVSLTFFALLMAILIRIQANVKSAYLLPPFFLLWVNLHGDFTLGIAIMVLFLGIYALKTFFQQNDSFTDLWKKFGLPAFITFIATLVNPFTYNVYLESLRHLGNPFLKNILEWDPLFDGCPDCHVHSFLAYCVLLIALYILAIKRRDLRMLPYAIFSIGMFWITFTTRRMSPVFVVVTLPVIGFSLQDLQLKLENFKVTGYLTLIFILIGIEFNLFSRYPYFHLFNYTDDAYCAASSQCSPKLVRYLKDHPPIGKGFNFYDWGGYFIGKGLPAKLFVDGRMHVWMDEKGYQPFANYIKMYYKQDYPLFNSYQFDWLIIEDGSDIAQKIMTTKDLGQWKLEFQDGVTDYFVRVK